MSCAPASLRRCSGCGSPVQVLLSASQHVLLSESGDAASREDCEGSFHCTAGLQPRPATSWTLRGASCEAERSRGPLGVACVAVPRRGATDSGGDGHGESRTLAGEALLGLASSERCGLGEGEAEDRLRWALGGATTAQRPRDSEALAMRVSRASRSHNGCGNSGESDSPNEAMGWRGAAPWPWSKINLVTGSRTTRGVPTTGVGGLAAPGGGLGGGEAAPP